MRPTLYSICQSGMQASNNLHKMIYFNVEEGFVYISRSNVQMYNGLYIEELVVVQN